MFPRIVLPLDETGEETDQTHIELCAMNGWIQIWIETDDGWKLPITFMTPRKMQENMNVMIETQWPYHFYFGGLILIEEITQKALTRALEDTWNGGYFKTKPVPPQASNSAYLPSSGRKGV